LKNRIATLDPGHSKTIRRASHAFVLLLFTIVWATPALAAEFNIPSQDMRHALKAFSKQSKQALFVAHQLVRGRKSRTLIGEFTNEDALTILLQGSGLTFERGHKGAIVILLLQEDSTGESETEVATFEIEEVTITSRRRAEDLQNAPLSVKAITDDELTLRKLENASQLSRAVANLDIDTVSPISGNSDAMALFLRGIGQLDFTINVNPGVGIYVDGVYIARTIGATKALFDMERVEVLRGPQGTLYGRNTIGGAVQFISKSPAKDLDAALSITLGENQRRDVHGMLNLPLSETLFSRYNVSIRKRDGYVTDGNGAALGDDDALAVRSRILWNISELLTLSLDSDFNRNQENGAANVPLNLFADAEIALRTNFAPMGEAAEQGCSSAIQNSSRLCFGPAWLNSSKHRTASTFPSKSNNEFYGGSLRLDYESEWGLLSSLTAYRELRASFQRDSDHTPFNVFSTSNALRQDQLSQEFQLTGDTSDSRFHWVSGLYYFEESASDLTRIVLPELDGRLQDGNLFSKVENRSWAIYGEITYDIVDDLHLTLGSRHTRERNGYGTLQRLIGAEAIDVLVDDPSASAHYRETTHRAIISYDWSQHLMTYAGYSEGFKSGGFNSRYLQPTPGLEAIGYAPEYVDLYELGVKYTDKDAGLRISGALFYNDYSDIQISTNSDVTGGATITQNAAQAEISGVELEFSFVPIQSLLISGEVGYLNARYRKFSPEVRFPRSNEFARIPEWSGSLSVSYAFDLGGGWTLTPHLDVAYKSRTEGTAENESDVVQEAYTVTNAHLSLASETGKWELISGVTNLTDEAYLVSANENLQIGYAEGVFARGREWYLSLQSSFF
jgi:iron complex outermembrane receptor protein